jgi:transposase
MYIRTKSSKNSPRKTVQIIESYLNEKGQPRQRIVQHLGVAFDEEQLHKLWTTAEFLIPELERRAQEEKLFKNGQLPLFTHSSEAYEREISNDQTARISKMLKQEDVLEGPFEVWGEVFDKLGVDDFLGLSDRGRGSTHALKLCLLAKLNDGGSKRRSAWWISEELGLKVSEDRFYRMMDKLAKKIDKVKELALRCGRLLCGNKVSLLLFDVTTLYFESFIDDEDVQILNEKNEKEADVSDEAIEKKPAVRRGLRRHGYSKDKKTQETQVILALATSSEGIPLWYDLLPGNTGECSTLKVMMDEVSKRVNPEEIWVVADGAMLTKDNRKILKEAKAGYVLGASVKKLSKPHQEEALDLSSFKKLDEGRKYRTIELENGNTVIVTWSESKAKKDVHDREHLIKRLLKKLDKDGEIKTKTVIGNRGTSKYIEPSEGQKECKYRLNQSKIEEEAKYDGLHGVETDQPIRNEEDVHTALNAYGNLWHIEDCFRVSKSDLEIRPMYHWTSKRIEAHVSICFLALLMERYLENQLKVRRRKSMSAQRIKDVLLKVNSTLIKDTEQDKLYRFPSRLSKDAREIYKALGLKRGIEATEITSIVNYRRRIPNISGEVYEEQEE